MRSDLSTTKQPMMHVIIKSLRLESPNSQLAYSLYPPPSTTQKREETVFCV